MSFLTFFHPQSGTVLYQLHLPRGLGATGVALQRFDAGLTLLLTCAGKGAVYCWPVRGFGDHDARAAAALDEEQMALANADGRGGDDKPGHVRKVKKKYAVHDKKAEKARLKAAGLFRGGM